jgi:predicted PurR-regulated permease PerM
MLPNLASSSGTSNTSRLLTLIASVVMIVGLYFGRHVLVPLALAVVLAFLFSPLVALLQKCRLGRVPAVLAVLLLAFTLVGFLGWIVTDQLMEIVDQFPSYKSTLHEKIQSFRLPNGARLQKATTAVTELSAELKAASESAADKKSSTKSATHPIPVQVAQPPVDTAQYLTTMLGPLTGVLETTAMVIVFTLFMLVKREDLRNRVIRLIGDGQLTLVTQALDDASRRLSRYLLAQFLVNAAYGLLFGTAAALIGIPHALLWGVLAAVLRFVPYVGTPIAALFPIFMALAVFPSWHQAALIFGVFVVLEIIIANGIEPWLYGAHTGISSIAILVAAVFWATLWGPVGLILSTPLTVCVILMGRYVPHLSFLEVLLGDEAVLPVEAHFYQRLLALDQEEAREIAEAYLKEKPVGTFYDSVLIPALTLAEQDRHLNSLEPRTTAFISQSTRELIEELGERSETALDVQESVLFKDGESSSPEAPLTTLSGASVVCIPASDDADELAAIMAGQLLQRVGCEVRCLPVSNRANLVDAVPSDVSLAVLISALPPFSAGQARSLCRLLRARRPKVRIILGVWGYEGGAAKAQERLESGPADQVATSLQQAISLLAGLKPALNERDQTCLEVHSGVCRQ